MGPLVVLIPHSDVHRQLAGQPDIVLEPQMVQFLGDVQIRLARDAAAAVVETEQETREGVARSSHVLRVGSGDVVEVEVHEHRVVHDAQLRVVVTEGNGLFAHYLCQRGGTLIGKVGAVDEIAIAGGRQSGNVKVHGEIEVPELGGDVLQSVLPVDIDKAVYGALTQIRPQVADPEIENRRWVEDMRIAECCAHVFVEGPLTGIGQVCRIGLERVGP